MNLTVQLTKVFVSRTNNVALTTSKVYQKMVTIVKSIRLNGIDVCFILLN